MNERLNLSRAILVIVDLQKAFATAIPDFDAIAQRVTIMVRGCKLLGVPIIATEQVPEKLGETIDTVRSALGDVRPLAKTAFSARYAQGFTEQLATRDQILLCGIETHICVNQTALDLLSMNRQVHLLMDAIGSRFPNDHQAGQTKMFSAGVFASSVELALFELMRDSQHEHFRAIQKLVK
jgi:nicotinamidase-related amidase